MKKYIISLSLLAAFSGSANAQSAIDAYSISQPDLKGTARFMGMAGAFGALGGDLSSLSQNPAGIGVYRSSDIGFTLDLDLQNSNVTNNGRSYSMDQTKFLLNNIGAVLTMKLNNELFPNFNFGFTYNKGASFNRIYGGNITDLRNSMSNYIAAVANDPDGRKIPLSMNQMENYPYENYDVPWITALAYDAYVINPLLDNNNNVVRWEGLWQNAMNSQNSTSGTASFVMQEQGGTNDFNIAFGGNIADMLYWGMNFDVINLNYNLNQYWGENLTNAYYVDENGKGQRENADWNLNSSYSLTGTGFNYQFGLIFKPVQAFRLGFAFHTPTWYRLTEEFIGSMNYQSQSVSAYKTTNNGVPGYNNYNLRTPWKIIASAAGVVGDRLILSFDYEWANYGKMHFSQADYYGYNDWYDPWWPYSASAGNPSSQGPVAASNYYNPYDPYSPYNEDIATYYRSTNTFRAGLEFRPISALSLRAGYSYVSSPVTSTIKNDQTIVYTSALTPSYRTDNETSYITAGLGFRYSHFYVDLAYVYKRMSSEYHGFTPDYSADALPSPKAKVDFTNNQIVLSAGYRF